MAGAGLNDAFAAATATVSVRRYCMKSLIW